MMSESFVFLKQNHMWLFNLLYVSIPAVLLYPPQTVFVGGYTVFTSVLPTVCVCVRVSVTFCFLNNFKNL